jgi:hypothetical protein
MFVMKQATRQIFFVIALGLAAATIAIVVSGCAELALVRCALVDHDVNKRCH